MKIILRPNLSIKTLMRCYGLTRDLLDLNGRARGVHGLNPDPILPIDATDAGHETGRESHDILATDNGSVNVAGLTAPKTCGVPVVAPVTGQHLLVGLAAGLAVTVGGHKGEQGEENDGKD